MPASPHPSLWRGAALPVAAFVVVAAVAAWAGQAVSFTYGDLGLYETWARQTLSGVGPVVDGTWVYPPLAIAPMVLPALVTSTTTAYHVAWFAQVIVLNLAVLTLIAVRRPHWTRHLWWYVLFTAALGPIALGRIDAIATPLALAALVFYVSRPTAAGVAATAGAWVKLAPGAALAAIVVGAPRARIRALIAAASTSLVIVAWCAVMWTPASAWSFLIDQQERGLQIESVAATPFVLTAALHGQPFATWNSDIITYEVSSPPAAGIASWLNILLIIAILVLGTILLLRYRPSAATVTAAALAMTAALIVFNKVGSPQFVTWLAAPTVVYLARDTGRMRTAIGAAVLGVAALTQVLFPWGYVSFLSGKLPIIAAESLRNLLIIAIMIMAGWRIQRSALEATRPDPESQEHPEVEPQPSHT